MLEPMKNLLLAGLGAVSYSQDKLKSTLHELVDRGELTREQGERILSEWLARGQEEKDKLSARVTDEGQKLREKLGLVSRAEHEALLRRVEVLEARGS